MIIKTTLTTIECDCCGMEFDSEYYDSGSIHHNNHTCDGNMQSSVSRFNRADIQQRYDEFLVGIALYGNICNLGDVQLKNSMAIFECRQKWFKRHGHTEIFKYMEYNRKYIKQEFDKVTDYFIQENMDELRMLEDRKN
jgi:hypothetical protein